MYYQSYRMGDVLDRVSLVQRVNVREFRITKKKKYYTFCTIEKRKIFSSTDRFPVELPGEQIQFHLNLIHRT